MENVIEGRKTAKSLQAIQNRISYRRPVRLGPDIEAELQLFGEEHAANQVLQHDTNVVVSITDRSQRHLT